MTWFFYEGAHADRAAVIRGDGVYEQKNVDEVKSAGAALNNLAIRPLGPRFETILREGEVWFAWPSESILPIVATKLEGSYGLLLAKSSISE